MCNTKKNYVSGESLTEMASGPQGMQMPLMAKTRSSLPASLFLENGHQATCVNESKYSLISFK